MMQSELTRPADRGSFSPSLPLISRPGSKKTVTRLLSAVMLRHGSSKGSEDDGWMKSHREDKSIFKSKFKEMSRKLK